MVIDCPSCNRKLNVPESLLGKMVKCPTCGATFAASDKGPALPPSRPAPETPGWQPADEGLGQAGQREEYDDEDGVATGRRSRRSRRWREAKDAVLGPAIGLIVTGALNALCGVCDLGGRILGVTSGSTAELGRQWSAPGSQNAFMAGNYVFMVLDVVVGPILGLLIVVGAIKMIGLRAYGLALTVSVLAVIPCTSPCVLPSIPIGIWALIVLNRPEVKQAFR